MGKVLIEIFAIIFIAIISLFTQAIWLFAIGSLVFIVSGLWWRYADHKTRPMIGFMHFLGAMLVAAFVGWGILFNLSWAGYHSLQQNFFASFAFSSILIIVTLIGSRRYLHKTLIGLSAAGLFASCSILIPLDLDSFYLNLLMIQVIGCKLFLEICHLVEVKRHVRLSVVKK